MATRVCAAIAPHAQHHTVTVPMPIVVRQSPSDNTTQLAVAAGVLVLVGLGLWWNSRQGQRFQDDVKDATRDARRGANRAADDLRDGAKKAGREAKDAINDARRNVADAIHPN